MHSPKTNNNHLSSQAPSVGSGEASLPGVVEQMQPQFISRFLEGQSGVTIKSVSCGDLFTTCMTGWWDVPLLTVIREIAFMSIQPRRELSYRKSMFILCFLHSNTAPHGYKTLTQNLNVRMKVWMQSAFLLYLIR